MIITFCGHSDFHGTRESEEKILACIREQAKGERVSFLLGGYGGFDDFAKDCCKKYKQEDPRSELLFASPYRIEGFYKKREWIKETYDCIMIPDNIGSLFSKYNILKRNEWMVRECDFLIAYVDYDWGGAAKMLQYAIRRKKPYINFGSKVFDS